MPKLSRWFIKSGIVYFLLAMLAHILMAAGRLSADWPAAAGFAPAYYHALMVGWITQIIMGVSFWMFPRESRERPRGRESLGWISYSFLNIGLLLRLAAEPLQAAAPAPWWSAALPLSAALQWAAVIAYVVLIWRRVK